MEWKPESAVGFKVSHYTVEGMAFRELRLGWRLRRDLGLRGPVQDKKRSPFGPTIEPFLQPCLC